MKINRVLTRLQRVPVWVMNYKFIQTLFQVVFYVVSQNFYWHCLQNMCSIHSLFPTSHIPSQSTLSFNPCKQPASCFPAFELLPAVWSLPRLSPCHSLATIFCWFPLSALACPLLTLFSSCLGNHVQTLWMEFLTFLKDTVPEQTPLILWFL